MRATDTRKSAAEMMSDILGNVGSLVRNEADLARAEFSESLNKAGASLAAMATAVALAIAGLNMVAASLVALLIWAGVPPNWAPLVVGVGLLLIALVIFSSAKSALQQVSFAPTRAARNVERDAAAIKDSFNDK
jgi:hypothetical protein